MWILIIVLLGYGDSSGNSSNSIEFSTKENCLTAQTRILKHPMTKIQRTQTLDAFCTKK